MPITMAEIGGALGVVAIVLLPLLAWMGKKLDAKIEAHAWQLTELDKAVALINAANLASKVELLQASISRLELAIAHLAALVERGSNGRSG